MIERNHTEAVKTQPSDSRWSRIPRPGRTQAELRKLNEQLAEALRGGTPSPESAKTSKWSRIPRPGRARAELGKLKEQLAALQSSTAKPGARVERPVLDFHREHAVPQINVKEIARREGKSVGDIRRAIERAEKATTPQTKKVEITEGGVKREYTVTREGVGPITNEHGDFHLYSFDAGDGWGKYNVVVKADRLDENFQPIFKRSDELTIRTDSGCTTGQLFGDLTCDCRPQLFKAMETIKEKGEGIVINIPGQDGRGMGLVFKDGTLWLQKEVGMNTVEAASALADNGVIDVRTYGGVVAILKFMNVFPENTTINLATNNPWKKTVFGENGYSLDTIAVAIPATEHTKKHFAAKHEHLGHGSILDASDGTGSSQGS